MSKRKALAMVLFAVFTACAMLAAPALAAYDMPDTAYDLSGKIGIDQSKFHVRNMVYDSERNDIYMNTWETGFCGLFLLMRYNIDEDTVDNNLNSGSTGCQTYPNVWNMTSVVLDYDTDIVFGGARGGYWGGLQEYSIATGVFHRAITGPSITSGIPRSPVYDNDGKDLYFGTSRWDGAGGDFFRYHIATGTITNLTYKLTALWGPKSGDKNNVYAAAYDTENKVVYLGGHQGKLARYNTPLYEYGTHTAFPSPDTLYQVSLASTSWGTNNVQALLNVSSGNAVYLGGNNGRLAVLEDDGSGNLYLTDLSGTISDIIGSEHILALAHGSGDIYIGGTSGKFLKYNISTGQATDLSDRIASFWGTNAVYAMAYDFNDDVVYLGGQYGRLARYNPASAPLVPADVDVNPDTLNKKSRSRKNAVTVYIEVPGYDITLLDPGSVTLATSLGSVQVQPSPYAVGDHDGDGIADVMVKFSRDEVIGIIDAADEVEITITGIIDDMPFEGSDAIRVIE